MTEKETNTKTGKRERGVEKGTNKNRDRGEKQIARYLSQVTC